MDQTKAGAGQGRPTGEGFGKQFEGLQQCLSIETLENSFGCSICRDHVPRRIEVQAPVAFVPEAVPQHRQGIASVRHPGFKAFNRDTPVLASQIAFRGSTGQSAHKPEDLGLDQKAALSSPPRPQSKALKELLDAAKSAPKTTSPRLWVQAVQHLGSAVQISCLIIVSLQVFGPFTLH
mmetsp:Transcript_49251/g.76909  ORF Transcript_49251/g.76909 Transcript_49251/m.76909 type:complete len:178 (-) Transcript_49251:1790-2323(-)